MLLHVDIYVTRSGKMNVTSHFGKRLLRQKWNESSFKPHIGTYKLNWARRTSWGWWDEWDDTVLRTQDSKFEPWWSEAEHATSRSRRLPTILSFTRGWGRNIFVSFKRFFQTAETGNSTPNSSVKGSGANHYPRAPRPPDYWDNGGGNEYFFYLVYFNTIFFKLEFFQKCTNCLFELQMPFSQNDAILDLSHIFGVKHATELCDIPF